MHGWRRGRVYSLQKLQHGLGRGCLCTYTHTQHMLCVLCGHSGGWENLLEGWGGHEDFSREGLMCKAMRRNDGSRNFFETPRYCCAPGRLHALLWELSGALVCFSFFNKEL